MRVRVVSLVAVATLLASVACGSADAEEATNAGDVAAGAAGAGGDGGSGAGGAAGKAGKAGGGAAGASGKAGAGGVSACDAGCKAGTSCVAGVCCDKTRACGTVCCPDGNVCSFQKCVVPGAACLDASDCPSNAYCEYALGDPPSGGAGAAGQAGAGGQGGKAGASGAGAAGVAGAAGKGGASGAGGAGGGAPMCTSGAKQLSGKCLPSPPECSGPGAAGASGASGAGGAAGGGAITCIDKCEYKPPAVAFTPDLLYAWGGKQVAPFDDDIMATPIVLQLDDDDCDGKVTAKDIPEIVFTTFSGGDYQKNGTLHVVSVKAGALVQKWTAQGIHPSAPPAGGNVDGLPGNEVVACGQDESVQVFAGATGKLLWKSTAAACHFPAIADLDQDGAPEIIVEGGILDGKDGKLKAAFSVPMNGTFAVSDIDGDGKLDIVTATQAYHGDGKLFVDTGVKNTAYGSGIFEQGPAVADFDKDGKPEVVAVYFAQHALAVWRYDASAPGKFSFVREKIDINGMLDASLCPAGSAGNLKGGGPATVGDFDGDGTPDIALAGGVGYAVLDGKKIIDKAVAPQQTFLWVKKTQDCSSAGTGSSLFDFDGDGKAEVVYADETRLRIYEGATGKVLFETCNTSGTLTEYPLVADVDNDGHADIVVVSNAYAKGASISCADGSATSGLRVFGDKEGRWVRTRRIWNQHAYHVTNVEEDGTIPKVELDNWKQPGLNDFRQNKQPGNEFAAPNAVVTLLAPKCVGPFGLVATVRNVGQAVLPAGVVVGFYAGTPGSGTKLGETKTTIPLYSAQAEDVTVLLPSVDPAVSAGTKPVYAVVDDTKTPHPDWHECRTDDDVSTSIAAKCDEPH